MINFLGVYYMGLWAQAVGVFRPSGTGRAVGLRTGSSGLKARGRFGRLHRGLYNQTPPGRRWHYLCAKFCSRLRTALTGR